MTERRATPNILDDLMSTAPAGVVKPAASSLRLAEIRRDGGTQPRAGLDEAHVQDLIAALAAGDELPPVDVVFDGQAYWLYDGFHRVEAHGRTGKYTVQAIIHQGTQADAQWLSYGVNRGHGLKRTNEDKKRAVLAALKHANAASLSNVQIAKHCGVDEGTIRNYRAQMESASELPKVTERKGADGKVYSTAKIGNNRPAQPKRDDAAEDAWRPPGIGARVMRQEAPAKTQTAQPDIWVCLACGTIYDQGYCPECHSFQQQSVASPAEAASLSASVKATKVVPVAESAHQAAVLTPDRQAQAAAAADAAFGMAKPRTQVLAKLLQDVLDSISELSKLSGKAGDCILLQSAAAKVYAGLVATAAPAAPATDLPADLVAHGWQLRQVRGGKWIAYVQPDGEDAEIHTNIAREKLDDVIGDARYLDKQLKIGASA